MGKQYFSLRKLKTDLYSQYPNYNLETLRKNLTRFKKAGFINSAGRGWYSFLQKEFVLYKEPVRNIINLMKREFPLLDFNVWSTAQLAPYFHHVPTRFFVFIFAKKNHLQTIYEKLIIKGKNIILNPSRSEAEKIFNVETETYILRPAISREPVESHYSRIEKILIDLYIEKDVSPIVDEWEYKIIFENIVGRAIIEIDIINHYVLRRMHSTDCPIQPILESYWVDGTNVSKE